MDTQAAERPKVEETPKPERSGAGMTLGIVTFLVGVGLLLVTFKLAYDLFTVPPASIVQMNQEGTAVNLGKSGDNLLSVVFRVLLLIVMGLMGSLIANRGVSLFTSSRTRRSSD